jgi:ADP-ribose pyrophosphatase
MFFKLRVFVAQSFPNFAPNIADMFTYKYPRPCVTTDSIVFRKIDGDWNVLLIQRRNEPFKGCWALPGGFVEMEETLENAAARELQEETGLRGVALKQLHAYGDPNRDPRQRTITIAYWGIDNSCQEVAGDDDAALAQWFPLNALPPLAFDHAKIIAKAKQVLEKEYV